MRSYTSQFKVSLSSVNITYHYGLIAIKVGLLVIPQTSHETLSIEDKRYIERGTKSIQTKFGDWYYWTRSIGTLIRQ